MATYTTNLDLKKPAQSDKIRIADINNNMDTIDGVVGDVGERSIAAQIGDVEGALAIVSTGNVHGAITSGQYVYIKNHDTLDDGLYVATTNISANGTLSSSNVTADSAGGGLNALNGKLTERSSTVSGTDAFTPATNVVIGNYNKIAKRYNDSIAITTLSLHLTFTGNIAAWGTIATIKDSNYFPQIGVSGPLTSQPASTLFVNTNGTITTNANLTTSDYVNILFTY